MSHSRSSQSPNESLYFNLYADLPEVPLNLDLGIPDTTQFDSPTADTPNQFLPTGAPHPDNSNPDVFGFQNSLQLYDYYPRNAQARYHPYYAAPHAPRHNHHRPSSGVSFRVPTGGCSMGNATSPFSALIPMQSSGMPHIPLSRSPITPQNHRVRNLSLPASQPGASSSSFGPPAFSPPAPAPDPAIPRRLRVPQLLNPPPSQTRSATYQVKFRVCGTGPHGSGVRVKDILDGTATLSGHKAPVLEKTGQRSLHLVISWPGFPERGFYISIRDKDTDTPIARAQLAHDICSRVARVVNEYTDKRVPREHRRWALGARGIRLEQIWLLSFGWAQGDKWLAELEVDVAAPAS